MLLLANDTTTATVSTVGERKLKLGTSIKVRYDTQFKGANHGTCITRSGGRVAKRKR